MTVVEMWEQFCKLNPKCTGMDYDAWSYGTENADELSALTLYGLKRATSSAFPMYIYENIDLPKAGEYSVVLDSDENAVCIICTTDVKIIPYHQVESLHAFLEGEGDRSLNYWRIEHQRFFTEELERVGQVFTEDMLVVCEEFEVVYPLEEV
ncbi:MAG: ASCH domain-containing protein [Lachnospiraceae bacterium]|nr:ASCH domain-containing protein [Lachnospiraceae bacterium]